MADLGFFGVGSDSSEDEEELVQGLFYLEIIGK